MNPFNRALQIAMATTAKAAGQKIVYRAGLKTICIDDAVFGATTAEGTTDVGTTVRSKVTDVLIMVTRLVYEEQAITPTPGHRIEHTVAGVKQTYEVQSLGVNDGCWCYSGPTRDRYRIHLREIPNSP